MTCLIAGVVSVDRLTRLVIRAKQAAAVKAERFCGGFVYRNPGGGFIAQAHVWTGKKGSQRLILSEHETADAALEAVAIISEEYPNAKEDTTIIFDDLDC